jgi:hypothetical protein
VAGSDGSGPNAGSGGPGYVFTYGGSQDGGAGSNDGAGGGGYNPGYYSDGIYYGGLGDGVGGGGGATGGSGGGGGAAGDSYANGLFDGTISTAGAGVDGSIVVSYQSTQTVTYADLQKAGTSASQAIMAVQGQTVTYIAAVKPMYQSEGGNPPGSVAFTDGNVFLCSASLSALQDNFSSGSCTASNAPLGSDTITATYNTITNYGTSIGNAYETVVPAPSPTSVSPVAEPSTSTQSQPVLYTTAVTSSGTSMPTGKVVYSVGTTRLCVAIVTPLPGEQSPGASCTASDAPIGTDTVTANYLGDPNNAASSATTTETVAARVETDTTTVASTVGSSFALGDPVTYVATVTATAPGALVPTGTVNFRIKGTALCSATVGPTGEAMCVASSAPAGTDTLTAAYTGDQFSQRSSGTSTLTVVPPQFGSETVVTAQPAAVAQSQAVTYAATVSALGGPQADITGTVDFTVGGTQLCTATLKASGTGSCKAATAPVGTDTVTAQYSGDINLIASTGVTTVTVTAKANPEPAVASISPASGPSAGGTTVVVEGSGFSAASSVVFGSVAAASFTVVSDNEITAVSPSQAVGTEPVQVSSPAGTSSAVTADRFTYQ